MTDVATLERAGYDTWTTDESTDIGGWRCYATDGFTRRVNCATGSGRLPADPGVRRAVSEWLAARGASLVVRVTPLLDPMTVHEITAEWGYRAVDRTLVMTAPVDNAAASAAVQRVRVDDDDFLAELGRMNGRSPETADVRKRIMVRVADRATGLWVPSVGVGVAVASGRHMAVYSVAVASASRRRGFARSIMAEANTWAVERGCDTVLLQVLADNAAAVRLYESLGFSERYSYHYLEPKADNA